MEHGLPNARGQVSVRIRYSPRYIHVSLTDSGTDKVPLGVAVAAGEDAERGRGFQLMNELMDYVRVRAFPDGGTRVSMMRRLDRDRPDGRA
jgi:anti-sigma regulatory factor (Ser/Thr protein kinase)